MFRNDLLCIWPQYPEEEKCDTTTEKVKVNISYTFWGSAEKIDWNTDELALFSLKDKQLNICVLTCV